MNSVNYVKDLVTYPYYDFTIDSTSYRSYGLEVANIIVDVNGCVFEMQPILIGDTNAIEALSSDLWLEQSKVWDNETKTDAFGESFTLKRNILIPELTKICDRYLGDILDIGSYDGSITFAAVAKSNIASYIGVDIIPVSNSLNIDNIRFITSSATDIPLSSSSCDTIISSMTLLNIVSVNKVFEEIDRIARKNSRVIIVDIDSRFYEALGVYYIDRDDVYFKPVFRSDRSFFSLKKISGHVPAVHCFHPYSLYPTSLEKYGFIIEQNYSVGPSAEQLMAASRSNTEYIQLLQDFMNVIKYPCFHFIVAARS
jgi:ubiquinone/menaquinone biosynthesis C-methylase UbiE